MRSNSHPAVGSPTVRVAAILAATLLLALALAAAGAGIQRLLAADEPIIVVAADGSGTYTTIQAAVDIAEDGDEIHVMPGTYVEAVVIDGLDIDLKGIGSRDEITLLAPEEQEEVDFTALPYALALVDSSARVSRLTLSGHDSRVHVHGGAPVLDDLVFDSVGDIFTGGNLGALEAVAFRGSSRGTLSKSTLTAGGGIDVLEMSEPTILANTLIDGPSLYIASHGPATLVEGNRIVNPLSRAIGLWAPGEITIRGNTIENSGAEAISDNSGASALIEGNTIIGDQLGIFVSHSGSDSTVTGNVITGASIGVSWSGGDGEISANEITDGGAGIVIVSGRPAVTDNRTEGNQGQGITVAGQATPRLSGNTSCHNGDDLNVGSTAEPDIDPTNEFCDEDAPE